MKANKEKKPSEPDVVKAKWIDGLRFVATDNAGHSIVMDAPKHAEGEGSGFSPLQLLLAAFAGCTGIDVAHIMRKQRQDVEEFEIVLKGERAPDPPRVYNSIKIKYYIKGKEISETSVQRAIQLSEEKYCSVGAMLRAKATVSSSYTAQI